MPPWACGDPGPNPSQHLGRGGGEEPVAVGSRMMIGNSLKFPISLESRVVTERVLAHQPAAAAGPAVGVDFDFSNQRVPLLFVAT